MVARAKRLRRSNPSAPGIRRRHAGRGFGYRDPASERVTDPETLERIRSLAIPPAWEDVWICLDPMGHIQAVGLDARGRRQYRYHDRWQALRGREKFDHMLDFARALPRLRRRIAADLDRTSLSRERVLACAARLLDLGFFRIGGEEYAEENQTYGLATMRKEHVRIVDGTVGFDYLAKGGKRRVQSVVDPEVAEVVSALLRRRSGGDELFAHRGRGGWVNVRSDDINDYIKEATGSDFTAKDFRTWNATVLAAIALAVSAGVASPSGRKRAEARAAKEVAHYLGNTPAVCRTSYIDPRVIDRYRSGETILSTVERQGGGAPGLTILTEGPIERAVIRLIEEGRGARRKAAA